MYLSAMEIIIKNTSYFVRLSETKISKQCIDDIVAFLRVKTWTIYAWLNAKYLRDMHSKGSAKENFLPYHTPEKLPLNGRFLCTILHSRKHRSFHIHVPFLGRF